MPKSYSISVVIPAYNIEAYIGRAIESVLRQTQAPDEIIVVDDGSTDGSAEVIESFGGKVHYIYQENRGLSGARNTGIRAAGSQWIALLDGDDLWLPDKLAEQTGLLQRYPDLKWCSCNHYGQFPDSSERHLATPPEKTAPFFAAPGVFANVMQVLSRQVSLMPNSIMVEREAALAAGLFQEGLTYAEDIDFYWRFGYRWPRIGYVDKPLTVYFMDRPGSLTAASRKEDILRTLAEIFSRHLKLAQESGHQGDILPLIHQRMRKWLYINYARRNFSAVAEIIGHYPENIPALDRFVFTMLVSVRPRLTLPGKTLLKMIHAEYRI